MKRRKKLNLVISDIKILDTVNELNKMNRYPSYLGVYKILSGSKEADYIQYEDLSTYCTLTSPSLKKLSRQIANLIRHDFLIKIYSVDATEEEYLQISEKGVLTLLEFHKKRKTPYKKIEKKTKVEIMEIH